MNKTRKLLSIAGSDPSGGAGIQADLKTFSAFGCYGMAAITALTAQNTRGVVAAFPVAPDIVAAQIAAVMADIRPDAIKIGMVATPEIAAAIAGALGDAPPNVVLDPVLIPTQGASLAAAGLERALMTTLLPLARLVTPNIFEASALSETPLARTTDQMVAQGRMLVEAGAKAVLVKGGDLSGEPVDVLVADGEARLFHGRRIATRHTHGTGCALSSAIAAGLAKGEPLIDAIAAAKVWLEGALEAADGLELGEGRGPPNHFYGMWR
ncbi:bifunctional hydroxymethylpyrimidine kinase/phosphomethylpyrimidine kinase [Methylocystis sp. Sn-Cys]|uniref:bifunctional hydroxymethylpyrimidine kinase/phosphomethylpyrimidine kinase n=1 Tax=Methylocystis sp. Sn-Cys TaxID=1701263 RepID=UPI0019213F73|nr:bifunctional hydroxymethylpyrimidine kinase/phosphomethylpyrimidine kinase [Methylocystis sp. Sn-Cys]MBL1258432.1 bifunctional hydroxymethylpyrimidine kinase/phosphomethylpyrimidine kinase [Methylocystis sp. Sn-Cys]